MLITFYHRKGTQAEKPAKVDTTSSQTTVYIRQNIEQKEETGEQGAVLCWEYDEAELTKLEYAQYLAESDAERIVENEDAMCEISTEMDERMTEIENALCELSEGGNE